MFRLTIPLFVLAAFNCPAANHYVSLESTNAMPPYATWATATPVIQEALLAADAGDTVVVSNGVHNSWEASVGSELFRVAITKAITLLSVNGPQFTVIDGGGRLHCAYLADGASLTGFTLTNGYASAWPGGGVYCQSTNAFLTNCVLAYNSAGGCGGACGGTLYNCTLSYNSGGLGAGGAGDCVLYNCALWGNRAGDAGGGAGSSTLYDCYVGNNSINLFGGGADSCTLYNCLLTGNSARQGGGAHLSTLYNCKVTGNSAASGGGADSCTLYNCTVTANSRDGAYGTLYNCTVAGNSGLGAGGTLYNSIVYSNASSSVENYDISSSLNHCCTTPMPTNGIGNITNAPLFVNGDLGLQSNSPCINAGNNAYVATATDLDGNPRIVGGTVDIGAYEYQGTGSVISYAWLQRYGLPTDGSADGIDSDHDGMNNWQEWICGTDPTDPLSVLRLLSVAPTATTATVTWQSVAGVTYFVERGTNLATPFRLLATNIIGQAATTTYTYNITGSLTPLFHRVGVTAP
jgi:hypothetical protein